MKPSTERASPSSSELFELDCLIDLLDRLYPRFIGQIDRDPHSPTFGSGDRSFWMYRLHDFESGVVQQSGLTLALLRDLARQGHLAGCRNLDANHSDYWEALAQAANLRTAGLLAASGFLDEYFPGERSFPGTVFAAYATLKSAQLLRQAPVIEHPGLLKTAERLLFRPPSAAANQDVAAAAFLALYAKLRDWRAGDVSATVKTLLPGADGSGRFLEYGGGDLGYASVSLNYLAFMADDGSHAVAEPLTDLAHFVSDFISPGGQLGGEFASRSTAYFLPFGALAAARHDLNLASKFARLDVGAAFEKLDDRYLMHYCLASLARAAVSLAGEGVPPVADIEEPTTWRVADHRNRGLLACHGPDAALFIGLGKGGSLQAEWGGNTEIDCGYRVTRASKTFASCIVGDDPDIVVEATEADVRVRISAPFGRHRTLIASRLKTIVLRLFGMFGPALNAYFKRRLVTTAEWLPSVTLLRRLHLDFAAGTLTIEDELTGLRPDDRVAFAPAASPRLVPSARFHQAGEAEAFNRMSRNLPAACSTRTLQLGSSSSA
ncbi:MAG: hypothetical protein QGI13_04915 [Rhodospirillales bacterium]|jgi:hypothetical protein|nr:hypothetical protein [Rhodospirillales bacterium]